MVTPERSTSRVLRVTPASERWTVWRDDAGSETGYVYLELSEGDDAEAKRGLARLKGIAG